MRRLRLPVSGRESRDPRLKESPLYDPLSEDKVRCLVCERKCTLSPGDFGFCRTRVNIGGRLYTTVYGVLSAIESRPIEIKPFYHFWPGSTSLTFSTWGCNFRCPWCQNWHLSQADPPKKSGFTPPEAVVDLAVKAGDEGLCVSFNEPLMLFEYSLDAFKLAKWKGLYCTYVSNGYMTESALRSLAEAGLDGLKIDIKGGEEAYRRYAPGADWEVPWRNASLAKSLGIHVELVYLVIPGVNDDEADLREAARRTVRLVGPDTPLHFTRYFPAYKFHAPPTPVEKLEEACKIAKDEGVLFAYVGNVPGHRLESTYCPECGALLIRRWNWIIVEVKLSEGKCPSCGYEVPIRGRVVLKSRRWL
ncbi:MAG TPA: AmmeMemoRadiSam system radical SAM enzyme [Candidatus Korarchaeota archaeon]|nr:AmmeMemoRadiSam system radical SAM enzyme [Candidatus Korarchaeota archaeon]